MAEVTREEFDEVVSRLTFLEEMMLNRPSRSSGGYLTFDGGSRFNTLLINIPLPAGVTEAMVVAYFGGFVESLSKMRFYKILSEELYDRVIAEAAEKLSHEISQK